RTVSSNIYRLVLEFDEDDNALFILEKECRKNLKKIRQQYKKAKKDNSTTSQELRQMNDILVQAANDCDLVVDAVNSDDVKNAIIKLVTTSKFVFK
ncbi:unnamed protein product, partial [Rotaria sp. Silwood2]